MDAVTAEADVGSESRDAHCHSERAGSRAGSGRAGDGGRLRWGTATPEPVVLPAGPCGQRARRTSGPAQGTHTGGSGPSPTS